MLTSPFPGGEIEGLGFLEREDRMKGKTFWPGVQGVPYLGTIKAA